MDQWIFLRGLVRESRHWGDFVERFQVAFTGALVTPLDLPGNGLRNGAESPLTMKAMVEDCRAQLRARAVAPPYKLLAISMGGMVAVQWANDYPNELQQVVAINTSMRPFNPLWERLHPRNYGALLHLMLWPRSAMAWEREILRMTSFHTHDHVVHHAQVLEHWVALRNASPVSRKNALRQLFAAATFRALQRTPPVPLLLLASTDDQLVSVVCSRTLARAWGVVLRECAGAGHDLPLDDPEWVIGEIRSWPR